MPLSGDQVELLSQYDFVLCNDAQRLRQAKRLRMAVFHEEQGFPADTEVDEYDPISAHFVLTERGKGDEVVGVIRVTPYPRKPWLESAQGDQNNAPTQDGYDHDLTQNQTSLVTSGGGPEGTSGGLPMFSGKDSGEPDHAPAAKTQQGSRPESSDDVKNAEEYPLGRPLPANELARRFSVSVHGQGPIGEADGAPEVRGAKIGRVAVDQAHRGKGLGSLLMREVEGWLLTNFARHEQAKQQEQSQDTRRTSSKPPKFDVVLGSQLPAVPFYQKLGYSVYGEEFDDEGAPHNWCVKTLSISTDA